MKLLFKQRLFSWFDSYDIYDEEGNTLYTVKGQLAWGKTLKIFDAYDRELGMVKQRVFSWLPTFELYLGDQLMGSIKKEFTFLRPRFNIDCCGWQVEGSFWEWDYSIYAPTGLQVAAVSKELWNWTDTYSIDVADPADALLALMVVLAIDAEKDNRSN